MPYGKTVLPLLCRLFPSRRSFCARTSSPALEAISLGVDLASHSLLLLDFGTSAQGWWFGDNAGVWPLTSLRHAEFLANDKPTDKGLFASRVYGENTILVAEAVWAGWLEGLRPEELCAVLVMLAAEDRERGRDRRPQGPRKYPTHAIAQTARLVRTLYFRFADMEKDLDEPNLRQPSHDYIDFAYRWASGDPLDEIPLPANADIGDAIKAMKSLYSLLRQLEWAVRQAKSPLFETVARAVAQMERDVIKRT